MGVKPSWYPKPAIERGGRAYSPLTEAQESRVTSVAEALITGGDAEIDAHIAAVADARVALGSRTDMIEPVLRGIDAEATSTAAYTANDVQLFRFQLEHDFTASKVAICMGPTSVGNIDVGFSTSADLATYTKVASSGAVAMPGASAVGEIALLAAFHFVAGTPYWFEFGLTDSTATIVRLGMSANVGLYMRSAMKKAGAYSSGLPASITGITVGSNAVPWFALVA